MQEVALELAGIGGDRGGEEALGREAVGEAFVGEAGRVDPLGEAAADRDPDRPVERAGDVGAAARPAISRPASNPPTFDSLIPVTANDSAPTASSASASVTMLSSPARGIEVRRASSARFGDRLDRLLDQLDPERLDRR